MEIGQLIKERREAFRNPEFTQKQLASAARTHAQTISKIERGIQEPRRSLRLRIFAALESEEQRRASLRLVASQSVEPYPSPLTSSDTTASNNRAPQHISKGGAEDDPTTTRLRQLESRVADQDRKIAAMQNVLNSLPRAAAKQRQSRKAASDTPGRGKRNR